MKSKVGFLNFLTYSYHIYNTISQCGPSLLVNAQFLKPSLKLINDNNHSPPAYDNLGFKEGSNLWKEKEVFRHSREDISIQFLSNKIKEGPFQL